MIIIDEDETSQTQSSERSPLKSPVSPVTAGRYDSTSQPAPPPYISTGPSSPHPPHPHHQHHHPSSPLSPHHSHPHGHHRHDSIPGGPGGSTTYAGSVHNTTNLPPHIIKLIEDNESRQRALYRFFTSFAVAWLVILVWTTLIRGVTLAVIHSNASPNATPPPTRHHFVTWPYTNPAMPDSYQSGAYDGTKPRSISVDMSMANPRPSVTLTIAPTPVAERILSIAYPPFPSPSR